MKDEIKMGQNTGVIEVAPKIGDFMAGGETGVAPIVLEASGQFDTYLPDEESQWRNMLDSFACVSFSAGNALETLITRMIARGEMPQSHLDFLKRHGYIDPQTGKVNFSDRFTAKMSGTSRVGNTLPAVGDSIRHNGMVPENLWPWPEMQDGISFDEKWNIYYTDIPKNVTDLGKLFATYFEIKYQWVLTGIYSAPALKSALPYGPVQIAALVCAPWNSNDGMPPIPACGCGTQHATIIYGYREDGSWKDFDHYKSFRKLLAPDYCIPYGLQYSILPKMEQPAPSFTYTFNINLKYGAPYSPEVHNLQLALQALKRPTGESYLKTGVFGPFGPQTRTALGIFQQDKGIPDPEGPGTNFGPRTRAAMNAALGRT